MSKILELIRQKPYVHAVDDEREIGNSIIVTLKDGWDFRQEPGCGVRGFDSVAEARAGTTPREVQRAASSDLK